MTDPAQAHRDASGEMRPVDAAVSLARRGLAGISGAGVKALIVAAAVCGTLSLGLKWGAAVASVYLPGWYIPGACSSVTDADGYATVECGPDYWNFGMTVGGSAGASGFQTAARVFVVFVAIAAAVAFRRASRTWARLALVAALAGLLLSGLSAQPGPLTYLAGAILLALALRKAGLVGSPSRTRLLGGADPGLSA